MTNEVVNINFPLKTMLHSEEVQNKIQTLIIDVYRYEAKKYLPKQTQLLANRTNLKFQNISVRNTKTRWGSCSYNNNISLSLHLMRLPNHLIDYVIFHELAHTLVKNHSHEFWNTLESLCPDYKKLDKELKNYDLEIF
jgi:predicted metal-dependent hydrolase